MLGTALVSTIMSDITAAGMFMAVALGMFERLQLQPGRSQFGKAVMIGIPIASYIGGIATPAGSAINILGLSLIERGGGPRIPFLHWMAIGVPMGLLLLPIAAWVLVTWFPPEIDTIGDVNDIKTELHRLGPITPAEWKLIVIMLGMILFWVLNTWFPAFDITLVGIAGATLMFAPGVRLFTWQEVQRGTGWDSMLLAGGVISLGVASTTTGLARWLVDSSLGGMDGSSALLVVTAIGALTVVAHLVIPVNPARRRRRPPDHDSGGTRRAQSGPVRVTGRTHRVVRVPAAARSGAAGHLRQGVLPDDGHAGAGVRAQHRVDRRHDGALHDPRADARVDVAADDPRATSLASPSSAPTPTASAPGRPCRPRPCPAPPRSAGA